MAKKVKNTKLKFELYKKFVTQRLSDLLPIIAAASVGDFSKDVKLPKKIDEFTDVYVGLQIMIEVVREKIAMLEEVNTSLEQKVKKLHLEINDEIFVGTKGKLIKINTREILFVKAEGDYVFITTPSNRHMIHSTMKGMVCKLSKKEFFRVHHSYIVRLDKITKKTKTRFSLAKFLFL